MVAPELVRGTSCGVTLLGDPGCPGGVTFAYTERTGGVSAGCYESLNLDGNCGDNAENVRKNRHMALAAIGASKMSRRLICPNQVHGDTVVVVGGEGLSLDEARDRALEGADAIVCLVPEVPVLLCAADCALVVLVADGSFAVVHSGWRGTLARISAKALRSLTKASGHGPSEVRAYVGPHIREWDYEVSEQIATQFADEFGTDVLYGNRNVSLGTAIGKTLLDEGVRAERIAMADQSTASCTDRFFSYRGQGGVCGRQGVVAYRDENRERPPINWLRAC